MNIHSRKIVDYHEVTVCESCVELKSGFLDQEERLDIALEMVGCACDLLSDDSPEHSKELVSIYNKLLERSRGFAIG